MLASSDGQRYWCRSCYDKEYLCLLLKKHCHVVYRYVMLQLKVKFTKSPSPLGSNSPHWEEDEVAFTLGEEGNCWGTGLNYFLLHDEKD